MTTHTPSPTRRTTRRLGVAAAAVAAGAGLALVTGLGPAPSLLSAAGAGGGSTSTTAATATTLAGTPAPATREGRVVQAGPAGSIEVARSGDGLVLVGTAPATGWSVEVERAAGREVEVDFRRGSERVQVDVEMEDGSVRERVRHRDDATGARSETVDGVAVADGRSGGGDDDRRGDDGHHDDHGNDVDDSHDDDDHDSGEDDRHGGRD